MRTVDIIHTDSNNTQTEHQPEKQVDYNQRGRHAEVNFIDRLDKKIKSFDEKNYKKLKVEAKLVQNYFPCKSCARKILDYQQYLTGRGIDFTLKITFANFYMHTVKDNLEGLMNLLQKDIALESLQGEAAWKTFLTDTDFMGR